MTAVFGRTATDATIPSLAAVPGGMLMVSDNTPVAPVPVDAPRNVMPAALLNVSSYFPCVHRMSALGTSPSPWAMVCGVGATPGAFVKLPTLNPSPPAN